MSRQNMDLELEYEHIYNMRDQTILFLKMCPGPHMYAEQLLESLEDMVDELSDMVIQEAS
ncbi:MAG: hypothetical protein IJ856_06000 [Candidatus Methanomethylophilaceae archaeon]|nr:hypothetical protein [Candidatus Methanomethylophilaceae archaeon]